MSIQESNIKMVANKISSHILEFQRLHKELDRIGRIFRDKWALEITDLLTKAATNPTDLTEEEVESINDYRNSGRSAVQWVEMGTAMYRLHTLLEPQDPHDDLYDPTLHSDDIAVLSMNWISGGNHSDDPNNIDAYNMLAGMSKIVFELEYDVEIYDAKIKKYIDDIEEPNGQDCCTGRTKETWENMINTLKEVCKVMFGEITSVASDQGKHLSAF